MLKKEFTEKDYVSFQNYLSARVGALCIDKKDNKAVQFMSKVFDAIRVFSNNIPSGDEWLTNYSFSLGPFIFLADNMEPVRRAQVLTHECQHVIQWDHKTPQSDIPPHLQMQWLYLVDQEVRVRLEVEAYRAGSEVMWAMEGVTIPADHVATILEGGYMISSENAEFAKRLYMPAEASITHGVVSTEAGKHACRWLESHGFV